MRSIYIDSYGGPEVVKFSSNSPIPKVSKGNVLVRVVCAGINFMDIHTRQGKYKNSKTYKVTLPCTLGMEGAGEIVYIGEGVENLKIGDRVAWCIAWGSYSEYANIPATHVAILPDGISYEIAAASMFQGCTAHYLINDVACLSEGSTCLIHAGSGNIGRILIQLSKRNKSTVFATASTPEKCSVAKKYGADEVFLYESGGFADKVISHTNHNGVDVVFDSVGLDTLRDSFRATKKKGLLINYGNVSGSVKDLDPLELGEAGSIFLVRPRLADYMLDAMTVQRRADEIFSSILDGDLSIDIVGNYSLENVCEAHALIEERKLVGKAIVTL